MTISSARTIASSQGCISRERSSAGSARLPTITGWTNSTETCCASVAYGPRPKASRRPPRRKRSDISRHASARRRASAEKYCSKTSLRSSSRSSICSASEYAVSISGLRRSFSRFAAAGRPPACPRCGCRRIAC